MPSYAIMQNPGHNRVYFKAARGLAMLELKYVPLSAPMLNLREEELGNIAYIIFDMESHLTEEDTLMLSRLSFVYAIFEWKSSALYPHKKNPGYFFGSDDITSILKYNGKTNELFTRFMLNAAIFAGGFKISDRLSVLDPLCGKGTSLFEALLCSYNVYGVDTDAKMIHEAYTFLKKYLENARYKHSSHQERQGMKAYTAQRYQIKLTPLEAELIAGDTRDIGHFYRKNTFHIIMGDLPYGVQHSSKSKKESRNAFPMLVEALPGWHKVLKPGGVLALAWNLFLIDRQQMTDAIQSAGFTVCMNAAGDDFSHRVDQAINRDVIIGIKS